MTHESSALVYDFVNDGQWMVCSALQSPCGPSRIRSTRSRLFFPISLCCMENISPNPQYTHADAWIHSALCWLLPSFICPHPSPDASAQPVPWLLSSYRQQYRQLLPETLRKRLPWSVPHNPAQLSLSFTASPSHFLKRPLNPEDHLSPSLNPVDLECTDIQRG